MCISILVFKLEYIYSTIYQDKHTHINREKVLLLPVIAKYPQFEGEIESFAHKM
jgi:hypothetical protein